MHTDTCLCVYVHARTVLVLIILAAKFWLQCILSVVVWQEEQERKVKKNKGGRI